MVWIEQAVQPWRDRLSPEQYERLISPLAVVLGWEAMVVLQDLRGLDAETECSVASWMARTIVEAMLAEAHPR